MLIKKSIYQHAENVVKFLVKVLNHHNSLVFFNILFNFSNKDDLSTAVFTTNDFNILPYSSLPWAL